MKNICVALFLGCNSFLLLKALAVEGFAALPGLHVPSRSSPGNLNVVSTPPAPGVYSTTQSGPYAQCRSDCGMKRALLSLRAGADLTGDEKGAFGESEVTQGTPEAPTLDVAVNVSGGGNAGDAKAPSKRSFWGDMIPSRVERKKLLPLGLMFFCILFNYTILRDTKDVLVVTAPGSGAEIIPFLKTYVNLPAAIAFTVGYSKLNNSMSPNKVFYTCIIPFLVFFAAFAGFIYPARSMLHPNAAADWLLTVLPSVFYPLISIFRNWTYAVFYTMAELWGSVVVSVLFWGLANQVTTTKEAKKYYSLFGLGANVALIFSGQYVKLVSKLRAGLPADVDKWGISLKLLMGAVCVFGTAIVGLYNYMVNHVMNDPECVPEDRAPKKKSATSMGLRESASYLAKSPYIRSLATLVIAYGMSINIVEVTWKGKLKSAFPDPNDYSMFMGNFSTATGTITLLMMLLGRFIFTRFGWGVAALITPTVLAITGIAFFSLILFGDFFAPLVGAVGTTPLMAAVLVGAAQNILSKSSKYSLFDPCKEMAYIPLDAEQRTKGKACVDVIGNPLGKSGGSFIQQILIVSMGSLAASTPYLAGILGFIIFAWIRAAVVLDKQIKKKEIKEA